MIKFVFLLGLACLFSQGDGQICGGTYYATTSVQTLQTPSYPLSYPNLLDCVWILKSSTIGGQVEIQFGVLDMEAGGDFLKVRDGDNENAKILLLPLTGYVNRTYNFISSFGALYISFTSDDSVVGQGFTSQYRIAPVASTTCGGNINVGATESYLSSPGYPSNYPSNSYCVWTLTAPAGLQVLMTVLNYQIESCCDSLMVRGGTSESSPIIGYVFGASLVDRQYLSKDGVLVARFRSDSTSNYFGFIAKAKAVTVTGTTTPTPSLPYNLECDVSLTTPSTGHGNFTSPLFPDEHPPGISCSWVITSPLGTKVHVWFGYINTETCCDWVKVRDGAYGTSTKLGLISGNENRFYSFVSSGNVIRVEFDSDDVYNKRGFRAYYETYTPGHISSTSSSGKSLTATSDLQYFSSPGFPHSQYPPSVEMVWTISSPFGTRIEIQFLGIITERDYDKITVYDGLSSLSRVIIRFSGKFHTSYIVKTSMNQARVALKSDSGTNMAGFRATYKWISL